MSSAPSSAPSSAGEPRANVSRLWLIFVGVALVELCGSLVVRARVAPAQDWTAAAARVRAEWAEGDALVSAPGWTDPLLREAAPDLLDVASAGRSDESGVRRLWSLSIRGHRSPEAPVDAPELRELVGRVLVERWTLSGYRPIAYDFVAHAGEATFSRVAGETELPCRRGGGRGSGGGLGAGPVPAAERATCGASWAGETVIEDLAFRARHCILLPPSGREPVRATFADVALGETLIAHGGLHWVEERHRNGAPVTLVVRAGETELLRATHADGDGWARWEREIPAELRGRTASVTFETTASTGAARSFCWSAVTLGPGDGASVAAASASPSAAEAR